ncbi:hypothetical protein ACH5RR_014893 [Cinchona calisaya]|uniref:Cysteine-rich receptor-like protein kinase n=1 Tax=Cinchona calisaya TaxID=153742 RepID=A0ABD2ZRK7_9GENT
MFSKADTEYAFVKGGTVINLSDPEKFQQVLGDLMNRTAIQAAINRSGKKFATQEADYSLFPNRIYALAQCTPPDLSSNDCESCLGKSISFAQRFCSKCAFDKVLFPSCYFPSTGVSAAFIRPISSNRQTSIIRSSKYCGNCYLNYQGSEGAESLNIDPESLKYSLSKIQIATDNFSIDNKISQGGFGSVYKGKLPDGQDIAVKRLSRSSGQGVEEFKNEIAIVAELRHNNLVRLLGFFLDGVEKTLIGEFDPNKKLHYFLFGWYQTR